MDPIVLLGIVTFVAAIIQGTLGFGFGMLSIPILVNFIPAQTLIPAFFTMSTGFNLCLLAMNWKNIQLNRIKPLILGGILGFPFGPYLLKAIPETPLKITISVVILTTTIALATGFRCHFKREKTAMTIAGILSSILGGAISIGGPPIVLFLTNQGDQPEVFRANCIAFFSIICILIFPTMWANQLLTVQTLHLTGIGLPTMALGGVIGCYLTHKISHRSFRWITLSLIFIASLTLGLGAAGL